MEIHRFGLNDFSIANLSVAEMVTIITSLKMCATRDADAAVLCAKFEIELIAR